MPTPKSLTINDCRITGHGLRAYEAKAVHDSDERLSLVLADYAAGIRAKRRGADVITLRLSVTNVSGRGGIESWTYQVTQGDYSRTTGTWMNTFSYPLTITAHEVHTARAWLEEVPA